MGAMARGDGGAAVAPWGFREMPIRLQGALAWATSLVLCALPWVATAAVLPQQFEKFPPAELTEGLWCSPWHWAIMAAVAVLFEPVTWCIHKYVMHGALWWVHEDHHDDTAYSKPELYKNDFFPLVFAVPSSACACWTCAGLLPSTCASVVLGALAYGVAYLYVHEEIFHHRFGLPGSAAVRRHPYVKRLATAHGMHHRKRAPTGATAAEAAAAAGCDLAFGFLYAPPRFGPGLARGAQQRGREETLWGYYGPALGFPGPCDGPAPAPSAAAAVAKRAG